MAIALNGCHQLIFTGGIGEHAAPVRTGIVAHLASLGARLDEDANSANASIISHPQSSVSIHVVRIDGGRQIAYDTTWLRGSSHGTNS